MMKILSFMVLFYFATGSAFADEELKIFTEEFAPYQFLDETRDGKIYTGISYEIVEAIKKRIGNKDQIKVVPWNRGLKLTKKNANTALFSTVRTPKREAQFKWVGPLANLEMVFFKKKGRDIKVRSLEEARQISKIGVTKNVATYEILSGMKFDNLDVIQSGADEKNLKRLVKGRIDAWPTVYFAGIYSARKLGYLDQIEIIPNLTIMSGHLYIAFNKRTDNNIIHQWQSALDQLRTEGFIELILEKYDR